MWDLQREVVLIKFLDGGTPTLRAFSPPYLCWELITPVVLFAVVFFFWLLFLFAFFFLFQKKCTYVFCKVIKEIKVSFRCAIQYDLVGKTSLLSSP